MSLNLKNLFAKTVSIFDTAIYAFIFLCLFGFPVLGERLSVKTFTTADGLANDSINKIFADSRGFVWFCTGEGLSRFDGYKFKNYTQDQGLPHRNINNLIETKDGDYIIASSGGVVVFNPFGKAFRWNLVEGKLEQNSDEPPMFRTYLTPDSQKDDKISKNIISLAVDGNGIVYAGTNHGLFRFLKTGENWKFEKVEFRDWNDKSQNFNFLLTDSRKNLWIATSLAVYLRRNNGEIRKINDLGGNSIFEDKSGNIWVDSGGNDVGIRLFSFQNDELTPNLIRTFTTKDGLTVNGFSNAIAQTAEGNIIVTSGGKAFEYLPNSGENEPKFQRIENEFYGAANDKSGNIWFTTAGFGATRYAPNNFNVYGEIDGIPNEPIYSIFSNQAGEVFLNAGKEKLVRVFNGKSETVKPFGTSSRNWLETFLDLQSKDGEFWIPTTTGLFRFPKVENFADLARTKAKKIYSTEDGLYVDHVFLLFEDSRGNIWISAPTQENSVLRWEKATDKIHQYTFEQGLPKESGAVAFGEDAAGNVWIGFYFGQLVRFKGGKFRSFSDEGLIPQTSVSEMITDKNGHFWLATRSRGIFRVENPDAETPVFTNVSTAQGLSSNQALCLTQDKFGRIYIGTGRGINRYDIATKRIKIFTQNDGLPGNTISQCHSDVHGNLWFSVNNYLINFSPILEKPSSPPPIFVDGISVNGNPRTISELGETELKNLEFASDEKQVQISFFAISFDSGESLRYQYKLNGQDWSEPSDQRNVDLNLTSGNYDFEVRAINSDGVFSEKSAAVSFKILPPIYQRWWFVALVALVIAGLIFALDRFRVSKTKQVEAALDETRRAGKIIRESEIRYRTLAETASDAIITIDKNSKIVYVNEACEQIFGFTANELIGKPLVLLMPDCHREHHEAGLKRYLESNSKSFEWNAVELPGLHKLGHEIPLELSFGEFEKDGERFFTGIARDISERKKAEAALQKAREERIAELQRVRSRIATDLHDDIGSSLTQITLFSEIARQRERENGKVGEPLDTISNVANELVETMSDIVWAINPKKDHLQDLTQRMRRFAANVLTAKEIEMTFRTPASEIEIPLGANIRREVFLIFKETVNNIVKHSEATEAEIVFSTENHFLTIHFKDNGKGFDQSDKISENGNHDWKKLRGGNGLNNMKKRARELGGNYEIRSEKGKGTTVILKIPLEIAELPVKAAGNPH